MEMGEKIKMLREQHSMTLEELGNKVGVGKSTVRKWENGMIANMRRDKIAKLANALHCSPAYLLGWDQEEIDAVAEIQTDASKYAEYNKGILKNFMVEISEMGFDPNEIEIIRKYAHVVNEIGIKQSSEFNKEFSNLFIDIYNLQLSVEDLKDIYTYAQFLKSKKKG